MSDRLRRAFYNAVYRSMDYRGRPADVGRIDGTVYYTDQGGTTHQNKIYVTFTDGEVKLGEFVVDRNGVPPIPGLPITVEDIQGNPTAVLRRYGVKMGEYTNKGTSYPTDAHNHYLEGPNPEYVEGRRFMPGVVHPSSPPALTVYVEPVFYRYLSDEPDAWEGGTSGSLSAYVPVVDDGRIHFVIIALDRSDNSIDIIDGADVETGGTILFPIAAAVTYTDILAIAIDAKYMPLAVVELSYGLTAVGVKQITYDHRLWGGEVIVPDLSPADNSALLFSQTADGTAANTTTPTDLFSTGQGSVTLPAALLTAGMTIRVSMAGHVSTTGTPDLTLAFELGGVEIATTGANALGSSLSGVGWRLWLDIVCRTVGGTGTVVASGLLRLGEDLFGLVKTTTTTIDTTGALPLVAPATWGTADALNTITCQTAGIERIRVTAL